MDATAPDLKDTPPEPELIHYKGNVLLVQPRQDMMYVAHLQVAMECFWRYTF
jgi:hypothetical protein